MVVKVELNNTLLESEPCIILRFGEHSGLFLTLHESVVRVNSIEIIDFMTKM